MDPGRGMSWVVSQSHMVMANHGCDSTDDAQGNASLENPSAGIPIPAALPDNQCGVLCEEDDWFWQTIVRAINTAQQAKAHNFFFCETCIGLFI